MKSTKLTKEREALWIKLGENTNKTEIRELVFCFMFGYLKIEESQTAETFFSKINEVMKGFER